MVASSHACRCRTASFWRSTRGASWAPMASITCPRKSDRSIPMGVASPWRRPVSRPGRPRRVRPGQRDAHAHGRGRRVDAAARRHRGDARGVRGRPRSGDRSVRGHRRSARRQTAAVVDPQCGDRRARISRRTAWRGRGTKEYSLPGAGKIWLSGRDDDLAVTTDGIHLSASTSSPEPWWWSQAFEGGVRILASTGASVLSSTEAVLSAADLPIQRARCH